MSFDRQCMLYDRSTSFRAPAADSSSRKRSMPPSMGIPDMLEPEFRAIQNIGRCSTTPTLTTAEPIQNASALRRSENWNDPRPGLTSDMRTSYDTIKRGMPPRLPGRLLSGVPSAAGANDQEAAEEIRQGGGCGRGQRGREVRVRGGGVVTQRIEKGDIGEATDDQSGHRGRIDASPKMIRPSRRIHVDCADIDAAAAQNEVVDDLDAAERSERDTDQREEIAEFGEEQLRNEYADQGHRRQGDQQQRRPSALLQSREITQANGRGVDARGGRTEIRRRDEGERDNRISGSADDA